MDVDIHIKRNHTRPTIRIGSRFPPDTNRQTLARACQSVRSSSSSVTERTTPLRASECCDIIFALCTDSQIIFAQPSQCTPMANASGGPVQRLRNAPCRDLPGATPRFVADPWRLPWASNKENGQARSARAGAAISSLPCAQHSPCAACACCPTRSGPLRPRQARAACEVSLI